MLLLGFYNFFLRKMDQKIEFGGTIGYGDSFLEFLFHHFKVFRLFAILQGTTIAVLAHSGKAPGYCNPVRLTSSLLGLEAGLLFRF